MWGGQQNALGDMSWIINRGLPTAGAVVLLAGLLVGARRTSAVGRDRSTEPLETSPA
jgi:hypothetical protein